MAGILRHHGFPTRMVCNCGFIDAPECLNHRHGSDGWFGIPISNERVRRGQLEAAELHDLLADAEDQFDMQGRIPLLLEQLVEWARELLVDSESGVRLGRQLGPFAASPSPTGGPASSGHWLDRP